MNNNEAKRVILEVDSCFCKHGAYKDCHSGCKYREALDAAVKALEQEPTTKNDLGVDWDELKRKIFMEVDGGTDDKWLRYADVCDNISDSIDDFKAKLSSVTPQEPRRGHWISTETKGVRYAFWCRYKCSLCGGLSDRTNFCPNCGSYNGGASNGNE